MMLAALMALLPQVVAADPGAEIGPPLPPPAVAVPAEALSTSAPPLDPFTPESVITVPNGPRIVKLPSQGSPVVAIRLSIPVTESLNEAGAGKLLQVLATQRLQGRASAVGLQFEGVRTAWGIAYTVVGSRAETEELVALLRDAVGQPELPDYEFERQRRALWEEVLRTAETPGSRILFELHARAAPGSSPIDGTPATLERMTRVTLQDVWSRTHRATTMSVVVAGDISDDDLRDAFRDFGGARGQAPTRGGTSPQAAAGRNTQVFRQWYGQAYRIADPADPHGAVVAQLASDWLRRSSGAFEAEVQLIELGSSQLLVALAAAYPQEATAMRQQMPRLLPNARQAFTNESVRSAVSRVRQEMLQRARTPAGLVSVVGRHIDASGEPASVRRFLSALDDVTLESTRAFASRLETQPVLAAEVRP
jgi:predicted Zn-dependent peptidase